MLRSKRRRFASSRNGPLEIQRLNNDLGKAFIQSFQRQISTDSIKFKMAESAIKRIYDG